MLAGVAALAAVGLHAERHLAPISLRIDGTESARAESLARAHFGDSAPFAVLLQGPPAAIDRQGPRLAAALRRDRAATVLSPWDRGSLTALRPAPRRALLLLDYRVPLAEAMQHTVPALEATLARNVHPPLRATQSGYASISRALQHESLAATERAELLAAPLLVLILLLVFRSALAALIPLAMGALTVLAGRGVLVLLSSQMDVAVLSLVVCTMMGLALGVDYSLLIVSRFREELDRLGGEEERAPGREHSSARTHTRHRARVAAARTRASAGRTVAFAGGTLFLSIFVSAFLQPGNLFASLATALVVVTAISVLLAWLALPALLALVGPWIDSLAPRRRRATSATSPIAALASRALRRPAVACALVSAPLLLLAGPALAFNTGAPGVDELSPSNAARRAAEHIDAVAGPGWEAPFLLVAANPRGPIVGRHDLALLARTQRHIAANPDVKAVIGPAPIAAPVHRLSAELASAADPAAADPGAGGPDPDAPAPAALAQVGPGLHRAAGALGHLRRGLGAAAAGSGLLAEGAGRARTGAGLIAAGLGRAAAGGERAEAALSRLADGTARLARAQREAGSLSLSLALELRAYLPGLRGNALRRARLLRSEAQAAAAADPSLRPLARRTALLVTVLAALRDETREFRDAAIQLNGALDRLGAGGERLEGGTAELAGAAAALHGGLDRLDSGAGRLAAGLAALQGGARHLSGGLATGTGRAHLLEVGLSRAARRAAPLSAAGRRLAHDSPRLFDSSYFVLSALDGAPPAQRRLASGAISLRSGGQAARLLVVADAPFNSAASRRAGAALQEDAAQLAARGHLRTGVTGGAAILNDYGAATRATLPLVIGAMIAVTFLLLVVILRAPLLAALTVALNLLTVGAAIGVMTLVCRLPAGVPLGGHPYIDTVGGAAIFGVTFGLSIDYAVFLLARVRESYDRDGDTRRALAFGLNHTAGVITGAAAIMAAVFVSFAAAPIATVSQMGVGLAVAILLDATVVRIVLLPALMLLLGDRVWHLPPWLDRVLPHVNLHGKEATA